MQTCYIHIFEFLNISWEIFFERIILCYFLLPSAPEPDTSTIIYSAPMTQETEWCFWYSPYSYSSVTRAQISRSAVKSDIKLGTHLPHIKKPEKILFYLSDWTGGHQVLVQKHTADNGTADTLYLVLVELMFHVSCSTRQQSPYTKITDQSVAALTFWSSKALRSFM